MFVFQIIKLIYYAIFLLAILSTIQWILKKVKQWLQEGGL
jgi:hypothetical protein